MDLDFNTNFKQHFMGGEHHFGLKNTLRMEVMKMGKDGHSKSGADMFRGLDTELRYTHGDKHCGAFFKFSSFAGAGKTF